VKNTQIFRSPALFGQVDDTDGGCAVVLPNWSCLFSLRAGNRNKYEFACRGTAATLLPWHF